MKEWIFLLALIATSCTHNPEGSNTEFTNFFVAYNRDSVFQKSSISFPLPVVSDSGETRTIQRQDWTFSPLIEAVKNRIDIQHLSGDTVCVEYSVEDTGIQVDHWFIRINGNWSLVKVVDSSD